MNPARLNGLRHQVAQALRVSPRTVRRHGGGAETLRDLLEVYRGRDLLRMTEVADALRVHKSTVYRWIQEGKLEAVQFFGENGPLRIPGGQLVNFETLDRRTGPVCPVCLRFRRDNGLRGDGDDAA